MELNVVSILKKNKMFPASCVAALNGCVTALTQGKLHYLLIYIF